MQKLACENTHTQHQPRRYVLQALDNDTEKKRTLLSDGSWIRENRGEKPEYNCQEMVMNALTKKFEDFVDGSKKQNTDSSRDESTRKLNKLVKAATKRLV